MHYLHSKEFDPYPFILLNLLFSTQAAYAAPLILLSQNRTAERDRIKAEHDFDENVLALRTLAEPLADVHDPNAQHGCVTRSTTYSASTRTASVRHRPTGHRAPDSKAQHLRDRRRPVKPSSVRSVRAGFTCFGCSLQCRLQGEGEGEGARPLGPQWHCARDAAPE